MDEEDDLNLIWLDLEKPRERPGQVTAAHPVYQCRRGVVWCGVVWTPGTTAGNNNLTPVSGSAQF